MDDICHFLFQNLFRIQRNHKWDFHSGTETQTIAIALELDDTSAVTLKIDVIAAVILEINAVAALALVTDAVAFCMEDYSPYKN